MNNIYIIYIAFTLTILSQGSEEFFNDHEIKGDILGSKTNTGPSFLVRRKQRYYCCDTLSSLRLPSDLEFTFITQGV